MKSRGLTGVKIKGKKKRKERNSCSSLKLFERKIGEGVGFISLG